MGSVCQAVCEPELVYEYLSRYDPSSGHLEYRILKIEGGQVHFEYHDNKDGGKKKVLKLAGWSFCGGFCGTCYLRILCIFAITGCIRVVPAKRSCRRRGSCWG